MDLTDRQLEIYTFVRRHLIEHGRPPTTREIAAAFGFASVNAVTCHLQALTRKFYLRRITDKKRSVFVPAVPELVIEVAPGDRLVLTTTGRVYFTPDQLRRWARKLLADLDAAG